MRVAIISHTYILDANRGKVAALARFPGLEVLLVVPRFWRNRDIGQRFKAEQPQAEALTLESLRAWSLGSGSLITYGPVQLLRVLRRFRPDLVHLEEEPWSFAALELSFICGRLGVPFTFFTWENTNRRLLLPFRLIRRSVFRRARAGLAGNAQAKALLETHGFRNLVTVLPQLGIDAATFRPAIRDAEAVDATVGYVGRLVPQKGLFVLLEAHARLSTDISLMVVGNGPLRDQLLTKAHELGIDGRLDLIEGVAHGDVPQHLQRMSVLVLPSLTMPNWKEQFGHVLIEAMACGVPVIGTDSGAIPEVIGDAGLVVPEGNVDALAAALHRVISDPQLRADMATRGRARVLAKYTNETIARRLAAFWESVADRGA